MKIAAALMISLCFLCNGAAAEEDPREKAAREAVNGRPDGTVSTRDNDRVNADHIRKSIGGIPGSGRVTTLNGYSEARYRNYNYLMQEQAAREAREEHRRQIYAQEHNPGIGGYSGPRGRAAVDAFADERVKEQTRRCAIESGSLVKGGNAECTTMRSMQSGITGVPQPPEITIKNYNSRPNNDRPSHYQDQYGTRYNDVGGDQVLNTQTGRFCSRDAGNNLTCR